MAANTRAVTSRTRPKTRPAAKVTAAEAQETEATGHYASATLCGIEVEVIPSGAWRQSTMRKLRLGDFDAFMEDVLSADSYAVYVDLDPTNEEVNAFMEDASEASGESLGKSAGPTASSRSTRKR